MFTPNVDPDQSLLQVKAGQSDLDIAGNVATSSADLAKSTASTKVASGSAAPRVWRT